MVAPNTWVRNATNVGDHPVQAHWPTQAMTLGKIIGFLAKSACTELGGGFFLRHGLAWLAAMLTLVHPPT